PAANVIARGPSRREPRPGRQDLALEEARPPTAREGVADRGAPEPGGRGERRRAHEIEVTWMLPRGTLMGPTNSVGLRGVEPARLELLTVRDVARALRVSMATV